VIKQTLALGRGAHEVVPDPWGLRQWSVDLAHLPFGAVRGSIAGNVRGLFAGDEPLGDDPFEMFSQPIGDPGLFGPDSVTWQVHSDASMLVAGVRALLLQTMHPLAMAGVAEHSDYESDPLGRLQRTGDFVATTTFGGTAEAHRAIEQVKRVHRRVNGTAPDGRPYDAQDPELLRWVHCAEVDSFQRAYQQYGRSPMRHLDVDRYISEMAVVAEALGSAPPPRTRLEMRNYFAQLQPELQPSRQARDAVRWILNPPLPRQVKPAYFVLAGAAVLSLPDWVRRRLLLLTPPLVGPVAVRPATRTLLGTFRWALGEESPVVAAARARVDGLELIEP